MNILVQKENFKQWLIKTKKGSPYSEQTMSYYTERINNNIQKIINRSNNPIVKNLKNNIYYYQTVEDFDEFDSLLRNDSNFDIVNRTGQSQSGWVSTPLKHYRNFLIKNSDSNNKSVTIKQANLIKTPLNQILYGPPGTGKTYNTVVKAMSIIHGKDYEYDYKEGNYYNKFDKKDTITYKELLEEYGNELKKEVTDFSKRIEFVTFHQSYSYEEFVEGIKPDLENNNTLKYTRKDGIFKEICNRANKITFEDIYKEFKNQYPNNSTIAWDKYKYVISYNKEGSLVDDTEAHTSMPFDKLRILFEADKKYNFSSPTEMQKFAEDNKISTNGMPNSTLVAIKLMRNIHIPYVLIIDEINRGNISKIFGELITLIEEDKRTGGDNALMVTLPYSQKPFSVPSNLYIIGTMNTADRSIALLDTALRRRFDFEEMPPDEKLLENKIIKIKDNSINLKNVLTNINKNIVDEKIGGLDKNYKIGHAFFINVDKGTSKEQESKLKRAFLNKIYPLLEEYFYDDEDKIAKVLNCGDKEGKNLLENIYEEDNWVKILERLSKQKTQDDEG